MAINTTIFMGSCLSQLTQGDILGSLLCPFSTAMTFAGFNYLYVIAFIMVEIMVYMRSQNLGMVGLIGMLFGLMWSTVLPPEAVSVAYLVMAGSFAAVMYKTFKSK